MIHKIWIHFLFKDFIENHKIAFNLKYHSLNRKIEGYNMDEIEFTLEDRVGTLLINRAEKSNAINLNLLEMLFTYLKEISKNNNVRVLVITSSGNKIFCAGADLKERLSMEYDEVIQFLNRINEVFSYLESIPIPTIAAMNGDAYGGGLELALCCDFRFLTENSIVGLTETRLGIIPGAGGTQRLTRLIGLARTKEMIFAGKKIKAKEALDFGLVNSISPMDTFQSVINDFVQELLLSAPLAIQAAKRAIHEGMNSDIREALKIEREHYLSTLKTKDRNEALEAFKQKRKPVFIGE